MAVQGKCKSCRVVYYWALEIRLDKTACPVHQTPLLATSYQSKWHRKEVAPNDVRRTRTDDNLMERTRAAACPVPILRIYLS